MECRKPGRTRLIGLNSIQPSRTECGERLRLNTIFQGQRCGGRRIRLRFAAESAFPTMEEGTGGKREPACQRQRPPTSSSTRTAQPVTALFMHADSARAFSSLSITAVPGRRRIMASRSASHSRGVSCEIKKDLFISSSLVEVKTGKSAMNETARFIDRRMERNIGRSCLCRGDATAQMDL